MDGDGELVRDVKVEITRAYQGEEEEEAIRLVDGRFHLLVEGAMALEMIFAPKDGHHRPSPEFFTFSPLENGGFDILASSAVDGTLRKEIVDGRIPYTRHGLRVVMERVKRPTVLQLHRGKIAFSTKGSGTVA